jgi:hypothetical protein
MPSIRIPEMSHEEEAAEPAQTICPVQGDLEDSWRRRDLAEKAGYGSATTPPGDFTSPTRHATGNRQKTLTERAPPWRVSTWST